MRMLEDDGGELVADRTLRIERRLPGDPQRVWSYLTDSGMRRQWLASGPLEPRVGGRVEHLFRHHELSAEATPQRYAAMADSAVMLGRVTRWDPPRTLAYTWPGDGGTSEVTFELYGEGDGTLLVLTHRRLADHETMISVAAGWDAHLGILIDTLDGQPPRGFWSTHARLEKHYRTRLGLLREPPTAAEHSVRLQRVFAATPAALYAAWTRPELMNRWLGRVEADVRVGGAYRIESDGDDGDTYAHSGRYLALEPNRHVRQTFALESDEPNPYVDEFIALTLYALPDGRALMDFVDGWSGENMDEAGGKATRQGWSIWFDLLDEMFEKDRAAVPAGKEQR